MRLMVLADLRVRVLGATVITLLAVGGSEVAGRRPRSVVDKRAVDVAASPSSRPSATPSRASSLLGVPAPSRPPRPPRPVASLGPATLAGGGRPGYFAGSGDLRVAPGTGPVVGRGPLRRYVVEVEAGLAEDPAAFARAVEAVLGDPRGWAASGARSLQRVSAGPVAFRVTLASPGTTDRLCRPLDTGGIFSCYMRGRAVLNAGRWRTGARAYGGDLTAYRQYMVNHEVGHALGFGHRSCSGSGRPAPVMMQQTKGLGRCRANPWPTVG